MLHCISKIAIQVAEKKINQEQEKIQLNMEKLNLEEQLLTDSLASKILLQESINAAIDTVCDTLNKLVGWDIFRSLPKQSTFLSC